MLSATELATMREVQALTMQTACTIVRRAWVADGLGGQTETTTTTPAVCRIAASANMPDYQLVGGRVNEAALWRATFPAGTDVRKTDLLTIGERAFEVLGILAPSTYETARVCVCVEKS